MGMRACGLIPAAMNFHSALQLRDDDSFLTPLGYCCRGAVPLFNMSRVIGVFGGGRLPERADWSQLVMLPARLRAGPRGLGSLPPSIPPARND